MQEIINLTPPRSLCRTESPERGTVVVGLVQHRWQPDAGAVRRELSEGIARAAGLGAPWCSFPSSRSPATRRTRCRPAVRPRTRHRRGPARRPDVSPSRRSGLPVRGPRARFPLPAAAGRSGWAGPEHRDPGGPGRVPWPGPPTSCTSPSPPATTRTSSSARARTGADDALPGPLPAEPGRRTAGHAHLLGRVVPASWRGSTPSAAPTRWPTPRPSAPSRTTRTSTPSRCGSRPSSATASPTGCSWWSPTATAPKAR